MELLDLFRAHNEFRTSQDTPYEEKDPHLSRLKRSHYSYRFPLVDQIPRSPGVYTLTGGRQIGKTTLTKQWIQALLQEGIKPSQVFYLTCDPIGDLDALLAVLRALWSERFLDPLQPSFIVLDEATYVKNWERVIKFLVDDGTLRNTTLLITASDSILLDEARKLLPGRRGESSVVDFHHTPISFKESYQLKCRGNPDFDQDRAFSEYLIHGGFLSAMNDFAVHGLIQPSTYSIYTDWIRGDFLKSGKKELYLKALLLGLCTKKSSQISWTNLLKELPIEHVATVIDYIDLLSRMDVVQVLPALEEHTFEGAPKKAKKILFTDPFIYQAILAWVDSVAWSHRLESIEQSYMAEVCAGQALRKKGNLFYIKAEGEVDFAVVNGRAFEPFEIKWTEQIRSKDLTQIRKYKNGKILGKFDEPHSIPAVKKLSSFLLSI